MSYVATLLCNPRRPVLNADMGAAAAAMLPGSAIGPWLAAGIAVDIAFRIETEADAARSPHRCAEIAAALRQRLAPAAVDVVVQPRAGRRKRLLVADMDSTMIGQECIDELADHIGLKAEVAAITERAMRGEIVFEPALRERVALLQGVPVEVIDAILGERIQATPGAATLIATMRANGAYTCLVSGGFTVFTAPVAARLGFHEQRANRLAIEGERLAGRVEEPILGREAKRATLIELRQRLRLSRAETLAVGDGANDLDMLAEAGLGVAFRAKPAVAAAAAARIDHADLTALLYLQGYALDDFIEAAAEPAATA